MSDADEPDIRRANTKKTIEGPQPPMKKLQHSLAAGIMAVMVATTLHAAQPAPERDQRRFEVRFLTSMIDHHYAAIKMAELCEGRTVHPELQVVCEEIIAAQQQEISTMQSWLADWYGVTKEPELDRQAQRMIQHLAKLTGEEFEKAFMKSMIEHHSVAIVQSLECLHRAYHADMINMCSMMIAAQAEEIAMMRLWLCQWYQICDLEKGRHGHRR